MSAVTVSAVVLSHNRRLEAARTVEKLLALPEQPAIVVVDNASSDGAAAYLRGRFPDIEVMALPRNVGASARNRGAMAAATPYVAFCDDDTWWEAGSLRRAAAVLERYPRIASLTARVLVGPEQAEDPTCALMQASPLPRGGLPGPSLLGFLAGATVFRREAFLQAGGYEPRYWLGGEEALLALDLADAGWSMVYLPELIVHHHPSSVREAALRRRMCLRNALWTAWLRRQPQSAWRESLHRCRQAPLSLLLPAGAAALAGLPWVMRRRRPVSAEVEALCRMLEQQPQDRASRRG